MWKSVVFQIVETEITLSIGSSSGYRKLFIVWVIWRSWSRCGKSEFHHWVHIGCMGKKKAFLPLKKSWNHISSDWHNSGSGVDFLESLFLFIFHFCFFIIFSYKYIGSRNYNFKEVAEVYFKSPFRKTVFLIFSSFYHKWSYTFSLYIHF